MTFDLWDEQAIKLSFVERSVNQKLPQVVYTYSVTIPLALLHQLDDNISHHS